MAKKNITIEDLAIIVRHGFDEVHERLDATNTELSIVKKDLTQKMEEGFFAVNRRLDLLHEDISDLPAIREELKDHDERFVRVEWKVGSGR